MNLVRKIFSLIAFLSALSCFAGTFGQPPYLWVGSWALRYQSDPCGASELPRALEHRNVFVNYLQSKISSSGTNISFNHRLSYEDYNASISSFTQTDRNLCEVVFYTGHGTGGSGQLSFRNGSSCEYSRNFQYGGEYTKWVFLEACHFFQYNRNPWNYYSMFNGAHAIFGFASQYWWFIKQTNSNWDKFWHGGQYARSEDRWKYFWNNWFSGQQMWAAYTTAMKKSHDELGKGVEPAVAMLFGTVVDDNGVSHDYCGGAETISNAYNGELLPTGSLGVMLLSNIYGNPDY